MKDEPNMFLVRAGRNGEDEEVNLDNNLAIIGFLEMDSFEQAADYKAVLNKKRLI